MAHIKSGTLRVICTKVHSINKNLHVAKYNHSSVPTWIK